MSWEKWTDPTTGIEYEIGTEGLEHANHEIGIINAVSDFFCATYPVLPKTSATAIGLLDWNWQSGVPTYGSWAGPSWASGKLKDGFRYAPPILDNQWNLCGSQTYLCPKGFCHT